MDPTTTLRLWRPAAQRKVRAAFSTIASARADWAGASSEGLETANAFVNACITDGFVGGMDIGVLTKMEGLKDMARTKLQQQQDLYLQQVVEAYEELVASFEQMQDAAGSMRTYLAAPSGSPIVRIATEQESRQAAAQGDDGLGRGIPVYACLSLKTLESLAKEMVSFYQEELYVKHLIASEFQSLARGGPKAYHTEGLTSEEEATSAESTIAKKNIPQDTLQVYLTAWLGEALLDRTRLDEIVGIVNEELQAA